jgi:hypothetical protein
MGSQTANFKTCHTQLKFKKKKQPQNKNLENPNHHMKIQAQKESWFP